MQGRKFGGAINVLQKILSMDVDRYEGMLVLTLLYGNESHTRHKYNKS